MAIAQFGSIITNLKGSIGGTTFSGTRSGTIAKNRLQGKKNQSTKAVQALNLTKSAIFLWSSQSNATKNDWNDFATLYVFTDRYGNTKSLTGYNWFISLATNALLLGVTPLLTPPTYATPDALPTFTLTLSATDMVVDWSLPIGTGTTYILAFATTPNNRNASFNRGAYRLLDLSGIDVSSSFSILDAWEKMTGMVYADIAESGNFNINCLIMPISVSSLIAGLAQTATGSRSSVGIGSMIIGSTFIVS